MGMNPFGEESDSLHAWKERYKQQQFQSQTLQSQLGELKSRLQDLQIKFEEINRQLKEREEELSETKQELKLMRQVAHDKEQTISELEHKVQTNKLDRLEAENQKLTQEVEDLRGELLRGSAVSQHKQSNSPSQVTSALIPMMLHEYDPENPSYQNAFVNLVETVIEDGDILAKIIGVLVKYGGEGPVRKIKGIVDSDEFEVAIELLAEEEILTIVEDTIYLASQKGVSPTNSWNDIETRDLFDLIRSVAEKKSKNDLISSMKEFSDILQDRQVPLTTIYFEIRKTIERIEKDRIDRKDVIHQIDTWTAKFESLQ